MIKRLLAGVAVLVLAGTLATRGDAGQAGFKASMNGTKEVGKADPNGRGTFRGHFASNRLCYSLRFSGLSKPVAAHIHRGAAGHNGGIVVDLQPQFTSGGARSKCVTVSSSSLRSSISRTPSRFYVNVHTQQYPNGAIRGQLSAR